MKYQSPCITCERRHEDKNDCSPHCERVAAFVRGLDWHDKPIPLVEEKKAMEPNPPVCKKCGKRPANINEKTGKVVNGLCGMCMRDIMHKGREKKKMAKTCDVDGCDKPAKARGKCTNHYDAWRQGRLPGHPPFTRVQPRKAGNKTGTNECFKTITNFQVTVDLTRYPHLRKMIFATAEKLLVPPEHVLISLAGEALAAKK